MSNVWRQREPSRVRRFADSVSCKIPASGPRYRDEQGWPGQMKITDVKVIVCCPRRNFVTLKIVTEDGDYGLGDATLNGRELSVASYLSHHVVPLLIGPHARSI